MPIDNDVYNREGEGWWEICVLSTSGVGAAGERPTAAKPCQRVHVAVDPHARVRRPRDSTAVSPVLGASLRRQAALTGGAVDKFRKW